MSEAADTSVGRWLRPVEIVCLGALAAWLLAAAALLRLEYYDGLDAVANTRLFLGLSDHYVVSRGPLISLLLVPAESLKLWLGLSPLDLRPHHLAMALLHSAYLLGCYAALARVHGRRPASLFAFLAAVPCFLFFSYAPFVSHDILPGVLLLGMLLLAEAFRRRPTPRLWAALVAVGAAAALIKHTYALFWGAVLVSHALLCFTPLRGSDADSPGASPRASLALFAGAVASALISWLALAGVLGASYADAPLLLRPLRQIQHVAGQYSAGQYETFPWWLYLRNLPAYGLACVVLLVPGIVFSLRGTRFQRSVALAWLLSVAVMHVLAAREVRYLAFLAPLSAVLIVPALIAAARQRALVAGVALLFAVDAWRCLPEAARIADPFYSAGVIERFLDPLQAGEARPRRLLINWKLLSFSPPDRSAMPGDRYHRVFHLGPHHLGIFYGYRPDDFRVIRGPQELGALASWPDGTLLILSSGLIVNRGEGEQLASLRQSVSEVESIGLRPSSGGAYATDEGLVLRVERGSSQELGYLLAGEGIAGRLRDFGVARLIEGAGGAEYALAPQSPSELRVLGLRNPPSPEALSIRGFVVRRSYPANGDRASEPAANSES